MLGSWWWILWGGVLKVLGWCFESVGVVVVVVWVVF